jgi:hypothetical protein
MSSPDVQRSLTQIPEQPSTSNAQFDNAILDVEGLEAAAGTITDALFGDPNSLRAVLGGCEPANVGACSDAIVTSFATKAFRRPPTKATQQSIRDLIAKIGGVDGLKSGVIRVLISPYFHQHLELGDNADDCDANCAPLAPNATRLKLSPYEVASRIAFQLTCGPPDDALIAAAASNALNDVDAITAQARRLVATPAARDNWRRIVHDWLAINASDPDGAVAKELGIDKVGFGQEAQEELLRFAAYEAFDKGGGLHDLLTDDVVFPFTDRLAKTFGVARSDAAQPSPGGHGGLLVRPAVLLSGTSLTSPILRGVFARRRLLCVDLAEPDPNAVAARMQATASLSHKDYSNRDYFTLLTSPANCNGCHGEINPVGYALEAFGPLGASRQVETIYDQNGPTGVTHPINTAVDDLKIDPNAAVPAHGAEDVLTELAKSPKAAACFASALVVNTRYRPIDQTDSCLLQQLTTANNGDPNLVDALVRSVANDGIFWKSTKGLQ